MTPSQPGSATETPLRIGIVANEPSGDQLGAGLMRAILARCPDTRFEGVGGPLMLAAGCESWVPMERLSVMGLVEVLRHLPELVRIRRSLLSRFLADPPDVFVGVDAPDFNLGLERRLRVEGIRTVHYVCPTVWAWREGRVKHVREAVDLLLSIFPFEVDFLRRHQVPVRYVGHPLAESLPLQVDRVTARERLGIGSDAPVIALLPGSRRAEVDKLARVFLETALWCRERRPGLRFVAPMVNTTVRRLFEQAMRRWAPDLPVVLVDGGSRDAFAACDAVLTASGTATLEAMLHKRPMVVGYRVNGLTYRIVKSLKLVKVPYVAMANLLAGEALAPEFLQHECRVDNLGPALLGFLDNAERVAAIQARYLAIHREMRRESGRLAAEAVLELIERRRMSC